MLQSKPHVALIMDGNGRWATRQGKPRVWGHREGAKTARHIIESAPDLGIGVLTLYAFSCDNWKRPRYEVNALMKLFIEYLHSETPRCVQNDIRLSIIGRRDRFSKALNTAIDTAEKATRKGQRMHLRIALDYSARDSITRAATQLQQKGIAITQENLDQVIQSESQNVDFLIRTSGEQRLSDFLLWEAAYAEFFFTDTLWPDFNARELRSILSELYQRERRFGGLLEPVEAAV